MKALASSASGIGMSFIVVAVLLACKHSEHETIGSPADDVSAKLADSSKEAECGDELLASLEAMRSNLALGFEVGPEDRQAIFAQGRVIKEYARDANRYECHFGLSKDRQGCSLVFFRRVTHYPGGTRTLNGRYGAVVLKHCKCQ